MAKIFFSMAGEGRGHATRIRAVVDMLRDRHEIGIFAPGDAWDLLEPTFRGTEVKVTQIPALRFYYNAGGKLKYPITGWKGAQYLLRRRSMIRKLMKTLEEEKPDLVITDFEMTLPRAAKKLGIPFLSLNHQHFLIVNDLSTLPLYLRFHAWFMSLFVRAFYSGQERTIVSSFYFPPLKPKYQGKVTQVGAILRPRVLNAKIERKGHLVAYLRRFGLPNVIEALKAAGMPVRVYGLGEREPEGNLTFCAINEESFVRDLASSEALISTSGNQLLGEALYLRKPIFALPEANNYEQFINAHFLAEGGEGQWIALDKLTADDVHGFIGRLEDFRERIEPQRFNGNPTTIAVIEEVLSQLGADTNAKEAKT